MSFANFLIYGQAQPPEPLRQLKTGALEMQFDSQSGALRNIRFGGVEVLRAIYAAVRDHNWGTVPPQISQLNCHHAEDRLHIQFLAEHHAGPIHFEWRGDIELQASGTLRYQFDGEAKSNFRKNRIGLCVLHPLTAAGAPARQTRQDGAVLETPLPHFIEPQIFGRATFRDLAALAHEFSPRQWAQLQFEGDLFEMEDQRNWTDASFKTYCTPLALPFPVEITAGTRITQSVLLTIKSPSPTLSSPCAQEVHLALPESPALPLPALGLSVASHGQLLSQGELSKLSALRLRHLRADLTLSAQDWPALLQSACEQARQLKTRLELAIHLPKESNTALEQAMEHLRSAAALLERILVLREGEPATSRETFNHATNLLRELNVPLGAGSDCNFCELNREHALRRLPRRKPDFLFWSANPQVHATDHLSVMETLQAQPETVRSARTLTDKPLVVSPITLKQRFNPVATGPDSPLPVRQLPPQVDPRQLSLFTAAWTVGSIAALAGAGASSLTYFETIGPRGVMESERGSAWPHLFPSKPGMLFPVYHLFAALAGAEQIALPQISDPARTAALAIFHQAKLITMMIANLTPASISVALEKTLQPREAQFLEDTTVEQSLFAPPPRIAFAGLHSRLELRPYATVILHFRIPAQS